METPFNEFNGLCLAKMACCRVVMVVADDLEVKVLMVGYVGTIIEVEMVSLSGPTYQWFQLCQLFNY